MTIECKWKFSAPIENPNLSIVWMSKGEYGNYLTFSDQKELDTAIKFLTEWMNYICFTGQFSEHEDEKRTFHYLPIDIKIKIQDKVSSMKKDRNVVWICFKVAMIYS